MLIRFSKQDTENGTVYCNTGQKAGSHVDNMLCTDGNLSQYINADQ